MLLSKLSRARVLATGLILAVVAASGYVSYDSCSAPSVAVAERRGFVFPSFPVVAGIPVFNVKAYGAVGDGVADDSTAIRAAESAAHSAGGGILYFPGGTYLVAEQNTSQHCIAIDSNVWVLGQTHAAIIKLKNGVASAHFVRVFSTATGGATNIKFQTITIDGNKANNTDASLQNDGIFLTLNTSHVIIQDVEIHDAGGDAITVHQNVTDVDIQDSYLHDNTWIAVGLGNAGGQRRVSVRHIYATNNAGGLHIEAAAAVDGIVFEGNYVDGTSGAASIEVTGGVGSGNWVSDASVKDNTVSSGFIQVSSAQHVTVEGNKVTNTDTSVGNVPHHYAAMRVTGDALDVTIIGNTITQTSSATSPEAVIIAGNNNNDMDKISVLNNTIFAQGTGQDGIFVQQTVSARIEGNIIVGNSGETAGHYGVNIDAFILPSIDKVTVIGNHVIDFPKGVVVQSGTDTSPPLVNNITVAENRFESTNLGSPKMTVAMELDLVGRHEVQSATVYGNVIVNGSVATLFGSYPTKSTTMGVGGTYMSTNTPTVNHGSLDTGSTNSWGAVTGIGANTSVTLTFGASGFANRSWCTASPNSNANTEVIYVTKSATAPVFNCIDSKTGSTTNCVDFTYTCVGQ